MDYDSFCRKCKHYNFTLQSGIICGINNEKPDFGESCEKFELDPNRASNVVKVTGKQKKQLKKDVPDIDVALRKWGVGLIILGVIHLFLTQVLNPVWGGLIIILGILNLVIQKKEMFIANGIALLLVGIMNIMGSLLPDFGNISWIVFGIVQVYWGIREIQKYNVYKKEEIVETKDASEPIVDSEISKKRHSGFGISSFSIFCFAFLLMIITFTLTVIYGPLDPDFVDEQSTLVVIIGFSWLFNALITLVGIGLGITGLFQKDKKKIFAVLGVILNFIIFIILLPMFLQG